MKIKKELQAKERGITLIALVITIIVLLILAGVSIAMVTGDNGILKQASKAKEETEKAKANEANVLSSYEDVIYETIGDVPQVNDSNPGTLEGNGTEEDPYTINSIEDLVSFADSVTNGNTYEEEYVKLNQSLDFKSDKSYVNPSRENYYGYTGKLKEALTTGEGFKPIGTTILKTGVATDTSNSFCGVFDGNGKQIKNCYMNNAVSGSERNFYGLFGFGLYGKIENFGLVEVDYNLVNNIEDNTVAGGTGISGLGQYCFGEIVNCYVTGKITETVNSNHDVYCAGIVCNNWGIIENSYNLATINGILTNKSTERGCLSAGISVNNDAETAKIKNCYNLGEINVKANSGLWAGTGGIVCTQTSGTIENCFNSGSINCEINGTINGFSRVGGVLSWLTGGEIINVYNIGNINISSENKDAYVGGLVGECRGKMIGGYNAGKINNIYQASNCRIGDLIGITTETANVSNVFYMNNQPIGNNLSTSCVTTKVTSEQLKSDDTLNLLNQNGVVWKKDTSNVNNGYPILEWQ